SRAETAAVQDAARARPTHSRRSAPPAPHPHQLAVGGQDRRSIPPDHDHPSTHLSGPSAAVQSSQGTWRPAPERHPAFGRVHINPTPTTSPKINNSRNQNAS